MVAHSHPLNPYLVQIPMLGHKCCPNPLLLLKPYLASTLSQNIPQRQPLSKNPGRKKAAVSKPVWAGSNDESDDDFDEEKDDAMGSESSSSGEDFRCERSDKDDNEIFKECVDPAMLDDETRIIVRQEEVFPDVELHNNLDCNEKGGGLDSFSGCASKRQRKRQLLPHRFPCTYEDGVRKSIF